MLTPHSETYWCRHCKKEIMVTVTGMYDQRLCSVCFNLVTTLHDAAMGSLLKMAAGEGRK